MGLTVVLAEKPSVGKDIARVLQCNRKGNGFFEGQHYIVTWALGHLVTLSEPEAYDEKYKAWRLEDLPMLPEQLKLQVIKQTNRQFHIVKAQIERKDVKEIVIATDAGREGELVARWIIAKCKAKKPIKRLWISSVTDQAIKNGFRQLKNGAAYENLYASAVARAEADWYVGINATRTLTTKHNAQLSCGRVQTPTLAMIAQREQEIRSFVPKPFYGIKAKTNRGITLTWQDALTKSTRTFQQEVCERILSNLQNQQAEIVEVQKVVKKKYAPQLYDLTELQREANHTFGYSAKETLSIVQRLYEQHKVLTYPRTDSRYISTDIVGTLKERLLAVQIRPYTTLVAPLLQSKLHVSKSFVDDTRVSDHHAIIPTEQTPLLQDLSDKERRIYDLVVRRFLAVLYPPFEYEQTTLVAQAGKERFIAKGKRVIAQGWRSVYDHRSTTPQDDDKDELVDQELPAIHKGDRIQLVSVSLTKGETKPPAPFNEGTLLTAMENPVPFMAENNKDLIQTLGKTGGIGTVATRADIIEKLFHSYLIEKNGRDIVITSKGKQLLELVPTELKSPALTAEWEQKLEQIAKGSLSKEAFMQEIKAYTQAVVREIKQSQRGFKHDNLTGSKCPTCGKALLEVKHKKGKVHVCQDRECGYKKNIARATNARCPNCHKKVELVGEGEGQAFVCRCGYKEKLTAFEKRKKGSNAKVSKQEVNKYLHKQKKEEEAWTNPALAEALAKLKMNKE